MVAAWFHSILAVIKEAWSALLEALEGLKPRETRRGAEGGSVMTDFSDAEGELLPCSDPDEQGLAEMQGIMMLLVNKIGDRLKNQQPSAPKSPGPQV
jgi:hypothetical protein